MALKNMSTLAKGAWCSPLNPITRGMIVCIGSSIFSLFFISSCPKYVPRSLLFVMKVFNLSKKILVNMTL